MMRKVLFLFCLIDATIIGAGAQLSPPSVGELPPLTFKSEQEPINLLIAKIAFSTIYNDNLLLNNMHPLEDVSYEIRPGISFQMARSRLRWVLDASPALIAHQQYVQRDLFNGTFGTTLEYQLTHHLMARFRGSFLITDNPFHDVPGNQVSGAPPNFFDTGTGFIITPQVKRTAGQAEADLSYELGPRTTVQVSGSFYHLQFNDVATGTSDNLTTSQFANGRTLYSHRLSRRHSAGIIYSFQDLATFGTQPVRAITNTFLYSHSVEFTRSTTLQMFAGPEHSRITENLALPFLGGTLEIPVTSTGWSWAAGAMFGLVGRRNSLRASFRHQIQNGGGLPGIAHHTSGSLEFRRRLVVGWVGSASIGYGDNTLIRLNSLKSSTTSLLGGVSLRHKLGRDLWFDARYDRVHQNGTGELSNRTGDADRVTAALEYQFKTRLGQ
jgi:hypothetical protein